MLAKPKAFRRFLVALALLVTCVSSIWIVDKSADNPTRRDHPQPVVEPANAKKATQSPAPLSTTQATPEAQVVHSTPAQAARPITRLLSASRIEEQRHTSGALGMTRHSISLLETDLKHPKVIVEQVWERRPQRLKRAPPPRASLRSPPPSRHAPTADRAASRLARPSFPWTLR